MNKTFSTVSGWRKAAAIAVGGTVLASGCGMNELQAIVVGVEAAADVLNLGSRDRDNDMNFGEWLISEIND